MEWFKDKKKRLYIAVLAGMAAALLTGGKPDAGMLAWWGTMYPKFCFSELPKEEGGEQQKEKNREVKISFWLAKALDW